MLTYILMFSVQKEITHKGNGKKMFKPILSRKHDLCDSRIKLPLARKRS